MKRKLITLCSLMLALAGVHLNAVPLGTAFTYQGRLADGANPAHGRYDLQCAVYDAAALGNRIGNIVTNTGVAVSNGLFSVSLDFGANIFTGNACWLAMGVRSNGVAANFTPLDPRQPLTAAPHALYAPIAGAVTNGSVMASQLKTTGIPGQGQVLTFDGSSLAWQTLAAASGAWAVGGNNVSGGNFLGTLNNLPMEVRVNNARVLRLEPTTGAPNVILGDGGNTVSAGVIAASIGGGAGHAVAGDHSTVAGGNGNSAGSNAAFVGGGSLNHANGSSSTLAGGYDNTVSGGVGFIGGGARNRANNSFSSIAGGENNTASGLYSSIPGGLANWSNGEYSFAAGRRAKAFNNGTFVWADATAADFSDAGANTFNVRASGGVRFQAPDLTVSGSVGIGSGLSVSGNVDLGNGAPTTGLLNEFLVSGTFNFVTLQTQTRFVVKQNGDVGIGTATPLAKLDVRGVTRTCALQITGGCDLAEPFPMSSANTPKGAVVVIDPKNPGQLKISEVAYDKHVAGIISGANGINTGIALKQEGALDQGENVALTGRVFVQADAANGAIEPGDLLTTSPTPGHAMKVTDFARAHGAILGKAMSVLTEGKGMVLVLVSLQ